MTKEQILAEAMTLDAKQRDELAEELRQTLSKDEFSPDDLAYFRQIAAAVDRGEMQTHDGEEVMRELFERLRRAKAG